MKYLLIALAVLGLIYVTFMGSKEPVMDSKELLDNSDRPKALSDKVMYQQEVEKAKAVEDLLQQAVDQRLDQMDQVK